MALMLEDKRAVIAKELHKAIHPRSTEPDHVTLNYAFMLMKKAVTKLAAKDREMAALAELRERVEAIANALVDSAPMGRGTACYLLRKALAAAPAEDEEDDPDPLAWVEDSPWAEEGNT